MRRQGAGGRVGWGALAFGASGFASACKFGNKLGKKSAFCLSAA